MYTIKKVDININKLKTTTKNSNSINTSTNTIQNNSIEKVNRELKFAKTELVNLEEKTNNKDNQRMILCSANDFSVDKVLTKVSNDNNKEPNLSEKIEDIISRIVNTIGLTTEEMEIYKKFLYIYQVSIPIELIKNVEKTSDNNIFVWLENGTVIRINSIGIIEYINTNEAVYSFYENGDIKYISYKSGEYKNIGLSFDRNGNIIGGSYIDENENYIPIDIFGEYNVNAIQYGGSQMDFKYNIEKLLQDPLIIERLKEYFPNATMEDYECYLLKICNVGCGYTALINSLFEQYEGREQEFLDKFGFPMYDIKEDGTIDYNYEYLILDYFNYVWGNSGYSIEELYGDTGKDVQDGSLQEDQSYDKGKATGTIPKIDQLFSSFLKEKYNIVSTIDVSNWSSATEDNYIDIYNSLKKDDNTSIILSAAGIDLYDMEGNLVYSNVGGHAMYITGIAEDGKIKVSSWGEEYIVDLSNVSEREEGRIGFVSVDYE